MANPLGSELDHAESQRQAELESAKTAINKKFQQRYLLLLQKAKSTKDLVTQTRIEAAIANLSTFSSTQYAVEMLIANEWRFEAPQGKYSSTRFFAENGSWKSSDKAQRGQWKFEGDQLEISLANAPGRPEIFKLPIRLSKWAGVGSNRDAVYLSVSPDAKDKAGAKPSSDADSLRGTP